MKLFYDKIPYYSILGLELQEIPNGRAIFQKEITKRLTQNGMIYRGY
jgi:hypothetical protein